MATGGSDRWVEVSPSQFTHESEGLNLVRALLPDESPFRAWSNFEFRDSKGRWHEVDLLVLGRGRLHLVELKYYSGLLRGDDHTLLRPGKRAEDSPLKLARRKAQYLATKLTDALYAWAKEQGTKVSDPKLIVPFVQESVFLHHPDIVCALPPSSAIGLYGIDGLTDKTNLPGISERLLEEPHKQAIGPNQEQILAALMKRFGLVQRRERSAGSWTITDQPLASGDGWQEWLAHHNVAQQQRARIRFAVVPEGAPQSRTTEVARTLEHEYQLMSRLQHDGIMRPKDLVQSELGTGLVYDYDESWQRLDLWLADQPHGVPLTTQLSIIRQIGEALQYAHANKVVHRELSPRCIWVKDIAGTNGEVKVRLAGWGGAGMADPTSLTHTQIAGVTTLKGAEHAALAAQQDPNPESQWTEAFQAPEGAWSPTADRVRIDVFGLGALAFYVIAQRAAAATPGERNTRLATQDGLDLSVELPQVPSALRDLVLNATQPAPTKRTGDIHTFLTLLDTAERAASRPDEVAADPLEATPGTALSDRFTLRRRLGQGSTAVGLLVTDNDAPANSTDRVLKVALHDDAGKRLAAEADTLRALNSPRIVKLVEGPLTIGGREALLLESAGEQTLGNELLSRTRLSLDLLERYGTELLEAVVALDKAGVDHRDIKPSNLGIREGRGDRTKHLVLFDFSLSGAAASATSAGTPPYLDPFLTGKRAHFDSAAERYAAAVVLFEMATGQTPFYGEPDVNPATVQDDATIEPAMFDPAIADLLTAFFTKALARDAKARHQTAEEMRQAWRSIFTTDATTAPDESADAQAAAAQLDTPLRDSGLTARALSALEPEHVATVGELLAVDAVRISRLRGVANATRLQITRRMKEWRKRLGDVAAPKTAADRAAAEDTLLATAETLLEAATAGATSHAQLTRVLLGYGTDVDALATQAQLGANLPDPVTPARVSQILGELQSTWASDPTTRAILERLAEVFRHALEDHGNVMTATEVATALAKSFRGERAQTDDRLAAGLLRIAMERVREVRRVDEDAFAATFIRRRPGRPVLIAHDQSLLDLADELGARADALVARASDPTHTVIAASRVGAELRPILDSLDKDKVPDTLRGTTRLAQLAAAVSDHAAATAAGDLHHRDLSLATALRLTFGETPKDQALSPDEIRRRVQVRFPALAPLPQRPRLDELVREAQLDLIYDDARRVFRSHTHTGDTTGLETHYSTVDIRSHPAVSESDLSRRVEESLRTRSFLALGVPADRLERFQHSVIRMYAAQLVDVTGVLLDALRSQAARAGVPWDAVLAADAEAPTSRGRQGLGALVKQSWGSVSTAVEEALAAGGDGPVVVTDAAPLARYDNMELLARWTDLGSARARAVWLVVPQLAANRGSMLDGQPVPLATPTQFIRLDAEWIDGLSVASAAQPATASPE